MSESEEDAFEQQKLRELTKEVEEGLRLPDAQEFKDHAEVAMVMAEPLRKPLRKPRGVGAKRSPDDARCPPLAAFVGRPWAEWVAADLPVKEPSNPPLARYVERKSETLKRKANVEHVAEETAVLAALRAAKENAAAVLKKRRSGRSNWGGLNSKRAE